MIYVAASQGLQVPTGCSVHDVFKESSVFLRNRLGLKMKASAGSEEEIRTCNMTLSQLTLKEMAGRLRDSLFNNTYIILEVNWTFIFYICCSEHHAL